MKKPAKLIMALVIGLSSLSLATAYADNGNNDNQNQGNDGNGEGGDHGGGGSQSSTSCSGSVVSACGLNIVQSTCATQTNTDNDRHDSEEHQDAEDNDREHDDDQNHKDNHGNDMTYGEDDRTPPSQYPGQDFSFDYYYDASGNMQLGISPNPGQEPTIHVDNSERLGTSPDGKITICHREGGAEVTLNIPDDQINGVKAHGHGDHDMDTIGRCEDEDDSDPSHDTVPRQKLSQKPTVTTSVQACLSAPAGTPVTVTLANGQTWSGSAPGCNASGIFCNVPLGGGASGSTLPNNGLPNRGGVRTLR